MIRVKASISVRLPNGKFPRGVLTSVLEPCRQDLRRDVDEAFAKTQNPQDGRKWPERKRDYPHPMLVKSGKMKERAQNAADTAVINGATITMTMRSPKYSQFHMSGTRFMAKRRFFGSSIRTRAALARRLKQAGLRVFSSVATPSLKRK